LDTLRTRQQAFRQTAHSSTAAQQISEQWGNQSYVPHHNHHCVLTAPKQAMLFLYLSAVHADAAAASALLHHLV
jgi:hypothetical protein